MAEGGSQGLGDLFAMFGGNPIASVGKNIENFRKGVEGFLTAVQNFNRTMETLDTIANRVTSLMDEIEEPIRTLMPQVTKATKQSLAMFEQMSEPLDRVIPGLERLAGTLTSPSITNLPNSIGEFLETLGDVAARLRPLSQLAEAAGTMAGNMFGGMRGLGSLRLPGMPVASTAASAASSSRGGTPSRSAATPTPAVHKAPAKKAPVKKAPVKKAPAKTPVAKKKPATKKSAAKKSTAKKSGAKR